MKEKNEMNNLLYNFKFMSDADKVKRYQNWLLICHWLIGFGLVAILGDLGFLMFLRNIATLIMLVVIMTVSTIIIWLQDKIDRKYTEMIYQDMINSEYKYFRVMLPKTYMTADYKNLNDEPVMLELSGFLESGKEVLLKEVSLSPDLIRDLHLQPNDVATVDFDRIYEVDDKLDLPDTLILNIEKIENKEGLVYSK